MSSRSPRFCARDLVPPGSPPLRWGLGEGDPPPPAPLPLLLMFLGPGLSPLCSRLLFGRKQKGKSTRAERFPSRLYPVAFSPFFSVLCPPRRALCGQGELLGCHNPPPVTPLGSALGPLLHPQGLERAQGGGFPPWAIPGTPGQRREPSEGGFGARGGRTGAPPPLHTSEPFWGSPFFPPLPKTPSPRQGRAPAGRRRVSTSTGPSFIGLGGHQIRWVLAPHLRPRLLRGSAPRLLRRGAGPNLTWLRPRQHNPAPAAPSVDPKLGWGGVAVSPEPSPPHCPQGWGRDPSPPHGAGLGGRLERAGKLAGAAGAHCSSFSFSFSSGSFLRVKKPSWGREGEEGGDEAAPSPSCWACVSPPHAPPPPGSHPPQAEDDERQQQQPPQDAAHQDPQGDGHPLGLDDLQHRLQEKKGPGEHPGRGAETPPAPSWGSPSSYLPAPRRLPQHQRAAPRHPQRGRADDPHAPEFSLE